LNKPKKFAKSLSTRIYVKIFLTVFALVLVSALVLIWAVNSEQAVKSGMSYLIAQAEKNSFKISFAGLAGSIKNGVTIEEVNVKNAAIGLFITANEIKIDFFLSKLLQFSRLPVEVRCKSIELSGAVTPDWLDELPPFPQVACASLLPANILLNKVSIKEVIYKPFHSDLLAFTASDLLLQKPDHEKKQAINVEYDGRFKDKKFLSGSFLGTMTDRARKLEGRLKACFAGQNVEAELALTNKKRQYEFSGHLIDATLDLAILSRWLLPLWQDQFPFGFDGKISAAGSWVYSNKIGFLGNFKGQFSKLRMVAQGLFITIFELNGNWKLFDGNLAIEDSGSSFVGFDASLHGGIENLLEHEPRFNINLNAPEIDMAAFYEQLPWGLKYTMTLPAMSGSSAFDLSVRGPEPEVRAGLQSSNLKVGNQKAQHNLNADLQFNYSVSRQQSWQLFLNYNFLKGVPAFFSRFTHKENNAQNVFRKVSLLKLKAEGPALPNLKIEGSSFMQNEELFSLAGRFKDGAGFLTTNDLAKDQEKYSGFTLEGFSVLQLILAY
jgi:hypothetical protein